MSGSEISGKHSGCPNNLFEQGEPTEQEVALAGNPNCPENDFIQLATGTGIIGILLFIGLIVSVLFFGFRNMDKHPEKLAITGALIAFILAGFINSPIQSLSLSILLVLLIALGTSDIQPARKMNTQSYTDHDLATFDRDHDHHRLPPVHDVQSIQTMGPWTPLL